MPSYWPVMPEPGARPVDPPAPRWVCQRAKVAEPERLILARIEPIFVVDTSEPVGLLRVGLWQDGTLATGFTLPHAPGDSMVVVDYTTRRVFVNGEITGGYARGYDGWMTWGSLPHGAYELSVEQEAGHQVALRASVRFSQTSGY